MNRPEVRRGRQQHHVAGVDHLLVTVESGEARLRLHLDLAADFAVPLELSKRLFEPVLEDVGHGDELDVRVGLEGVLGGPRPAAAAADQADLEEIVLASEEAGLRKGETAGDGRRGEEIAAGGGRFWVHRGGTPKALREAGGGECYCVVRIGGLPAELAW